MHWLWWALAGYGYESWRAAGLLVPFYLVGFAVFSQADMPLARSPEVYAFNPLIHTTDVLIPFIDWKQAAQCAPDTTGALWWL